MQGYTFQLKIARAGPQQCLQVDYYLDKMEYQQLEAIKWARRTSRIELLYFGWRFQHTIGYAAEAPFCASNCNIYIDVLDMIYKYFKMCNWWFSCGVPL
jgi:hypothetical protein